MRKSEFKRFLESLSEEELRKELEMIYSNFKEVKLYYGMELGNEEARTSVFEKAKKEITAKYSSKRLDRPKRPRVGKINMLLKKMEKVSIFKEEMADLHLFNVEQGIAFSERHYYYSKPLFNTIISSFSKASALILESMGQDSFKDRCVDIVDKAFQTHDFLGESLKSILENEIMITKN